ncbi:hypothetical protein SIPHO059v1_p0088 [Vibrio phage 264E42.1]|nr:hypothetical protein SIPHO059v1_p0088 [Vibrio phage 264E42.1]
MQNANIKHYIYIWDDSNYNNRREAEESGAVNKHEIVVPDDIHGQEAIQRFITDAFNTYVWAVKHAGKVLANDDRILGFELVKLKPFPVSAELLEWNRYTVTAYAETAVEAVALVKRNGVVTFKTDDVETGSTEFNGEVGDDHQRFERLDV